MTGAALAILHPQMPLFHWSPSARRPQIIRYGLRPRQRATTSVQWVAPYVCFAESPSWAWALSGAFSPRIACWDLWQTSLGRLTLPQILPSYDEHMVHEIRTEHRVFKRDLWHVATRAA